MRNTLFNLLMRAAILFCILCSIQPVWAHESEISPDNSAADSAVQSSGVLERLDQAAALDAAFIDADNRAVTIGDLVDKPTLLLPVYFSCPNVCDILQGNMTGILPGVKLSPGRDYQVLSVSFDANDTSRIAARKKKDYLAAMPGFPENGWRFLTGNQENINKLMNSIGFSFRREEKNISHPVVAVALAPDGRIIRYLYGYDFLPFDITMAMLEAGRGKSALSVKRVLAYCFSYDPAGKRYVLNFTRVAGLLILFLLAGFGLALLLAGRKRKSTQP